MTKTSTPSSQIYSHSTSEGMVNGESVRKELVLNGLLTTHLKMIKIKLSVAVEVNLDFYQLFRAGQSKSLKAKNTMKGYTKSL